MSERYHYDKRSDTLYILLKPGTEDSFEEIFPGVNVELNKKNEVVGVEIMHVSRFGKGAKAFLSPEKNTNKLHLRRK
jgi:uncharacterized protein YuzE